MRILDASLNRAAEGLRVVEDYLRLAVDDGYLTRLVKLLRHDLAAAVKEIPSNERHAARDIASDVGAGFSAPDEARRIDAWDVCVASMERAKQSLRSLEEFGKLVSPRWSAKIEAMRYRLYAIEAAIGRTVEAADRLAGVRLCVLIDGGESEEQFSRLVSDLLSAGVGAIQLRDKRLDDRQLVARARLMRQATRESRRAALAIINDRPDVAAIVDADGVHLGQEDLSVKDARAIMGSRKLIGVSTHTLEQAEDAVLGGANYLGAGPVFPSRTKSFVAFPGLELLRRIGAEIRLPVFAIGGIEPANVGDVLAAGVARIAVGAAVTSAPSPARAAAELLKQLDARPVEPMPAARV